MRPQGNQQDLFEEDRRLPDILGEQRTILLQLIERLLVEALAGRRDPANHEGAEVVHE
jgi:hypothetical protein